MEIGKLYNILIDIVNEQTTDKIQPQIANLSSYILNNNSAEIEKTLETLEKDFHESVINNYVPSDIEILEDIKVIKYFGDCSFNEIKTILNSTSYNTKKVYDDLTRYNTERSNTITKLKELKTLFEFFDIPVLYPINNFHLGILIPEDYSKNSIPNITKELNKWDKLIKTFKELIGENPDDTKIDFVSNGSLDFFIENSIEIAQIVSSILSSVLIAYDKVSKIRTKRAELKELGITSAEEKNIEKQEKEFLSKEIDTISADIIKQFASKKIDAGRLNELKISVRNQVVYVAKCVDNGITIEINPPQEIEEPVEVKEGDNAETKKEKQQNLKNYEDKLKKVELIQKSMETVKNIGKLGLDIAKFLTFEGNDENPT